MFGEEFWCGCSAEPVAACSGATGSRGGYRRMKLCLRRAKASAPAQKTAPRIKLVRINRETVEVWPAKPTAVTGRFAA